MPSMPASTPARPSSAGSRLVIPSASEGAAGRPHLSPNKVRRTNHKVRLLPIAHQSGATASTSTSSRSQAQPPMSMPHHPQQSLSTGSAVPTGRVPTALNPRPFEGRVLFDTDDGSMSSTALSPEAPQGKMFAWRGSNAKENQSSSAGQQHCSTNSQTRPASAKLPQPSANGQTAWLGTQQQQQHQQLQTARGAGPSGWSSSGTDAASGLQGKPRKTYRAQSEDGLSPPVALREAHRRDQDDDAMAPAYADDRHLHTRDTTYHSMERHMRRLDLATPHELSQRSTDGSGYWAQGRNSLHNHPLPPAMNTSSQHQGLAGFTRNIPAGALSPLHGGTSPTTFGARLASRGLRSASGGGFVATDHTLLSQTPSMQCYYETTQDTTLADTVSARIHTDYVEVSHLGSGNFGSVTLCRDRSTGEHVAVKKIGPISSHYDEKQFLKERLLLAHIRGLSRHVLPLLTAWVEGGGPNAGCPTRAFGDRPVSGRPSDGSSSLTTGHRNGYLVTPYYPNGTLADLVAYRRSADLEWSDDEVRAFVGEMAEALFTLHSVCSISHVDFKPENILIDSDGAYVLSDFGLAQFIDPSGRPVGGKVTGPIVRSALGGPIAASQSRAPSEAPLRSASQQAGPYGSVRHSASAQLFASADSQSQTAGLSIFAAGAFGAPSGHVGPLPPGLASIVNDRSDSVAYSLNTFMSQDEGDCRYVSCDMMNMKQFYMAGDMFALGISMFELLSGESAPKSGQLYADLRSGNPNLVLHRCPRLSSRHDDLLGLMFALLSPDPTTIPTAFAVLRHPAIMRTSASALDLAAAATAPLPDNAWVPIPRAALPQEESEGTSGGLPSEDRATRSGTPQNATATTQVHAQTGSGNGGGSRGPNSSGLSHIGSSGARTAGYSGVSPPEYVSSPLMFPTHPPVGGFETPGTRSPQHTMDSMQFVAPDPQYTPARTPTEVAQNSTHHHEGSDPQGARRQPPANQRAKAVHNMISAPGFAEARLAKVQLTVAVAILKTQLPMRGQPQTSLIASSPPLL